MPIWSSLNDLEKKLLFDRLHSRIESRVSETTELRRLLAKVLLASNATAAGAIIAFIASIARHGDGDKSIIPSCGVAALFFVLGFIASFIFLMIAVARSRDTLIAESKYLEQVIAHDIEIHWHENPLILEYGVWQFAIALLFAAASGGSFVVGIGIVLTVILTMI